MCATCGCGQPKNKHGQKTVAAANKKFDKKDGEKTMCKKCKKTKCVCKNAKCTNCGKANCSCKTKKAPAKKK
jgi:hypothetical protein